MEVIKATSSNFKIGRKGRRIIAIVNHITAGLMPGTLSWLQNPTAKVSAHYLVTKQGVLYRLVKDEDTAYHVGIVSQPNWPLYDGTNPNFYTIGIEHEALTGEALTEEQYQATLWLHRQLIARWDIPVDNNHIIGHYRIDSINRKNDPGEKFPWERLFTDLQNKPPTSKSAPITIKLERPAIQGLLIDEVSYGPVRTICESLGRKVEWDSETNTVLIPPVDIPIPVSTEIKIATGNTLIPVVMQGNTAYAPLKKLMDTLGYPLQWDGNSQTVFIEQIK